jgi:hypothetical protein
MATLRRRLAIVTSLLLLVVCIGGLEATPGSHKVRPGLLGSDLEVQTSSSGARVVFMIGIHSEPDWWDMAVPCIVSAACKVSLGGKPIILFVDESNGVDQLSQSESDFLELYRPELVYLIGLSGVSPPMPARTTVVSGTNETEISARIALAFWNSSSTVVLALGDDYKSALLASTVASHFELPLLYVQSSHLAEPVREAVRKLGASEAIVVSARTVDLGGILQVTALLTNDSQVAKYITQRDAVDYVVLANPLDRNKGAVRKLSLVASVLSAGRNAIVSISDYQGRQDQTFAVDSTTFAMPKGAPDAAVLNSSAQYNALMLSHAGKGPGVEAQFYATETTVPPERAPGSRWQVYPVNGKYLVMNDPIYKWTYFIDDWHHIYVAASSPNSTEYDVVLFDKQIIGEGVGVFSDDEVFHQGDFFEYRPDCPFFHCYLMIERIGGSSVDTQELTIRYVTWKTGTIRLDGRSYPFVLSCTSEAFGNYDTFSADLNGNHHFNDTGEGPFITGDTFAVDDVDYSVVVSPCGLQVSLVRPDPKSVALDLKKFLTETEVVPQYLAIVGYPDLVPYGIVPSPGVRARPPCVELDEYVPTDNTYGQLDTDPFLDVAEGRILAENAIECSSLVARALAYDYLANDDSWRSRAFVTSIGVAGTAGTGVPATMEYDLRNTGFDVSTYYWGIGEPFPRQLILSNLSRKSLIWLVGHADVYSIGDDSVQSQDQSWQLGTPSVVVAHGCDVGRLTQEVDPHQSLVNAFIARGAVAVLAPTGLTGGGPDVFYSAFGVSLIYHNMTLGSALLYAKKYAVVRGGLDENLLMVTLYGDPSLRLHLPSAPRKKPVSLSVAVGPNGSIVVSVNPSEEYDNLDRIRVPLRDYWQNVTHIPGMIYELTYHNYLVELSGLGDRLDHLVVRDRSAITRRFVGDNGWIVPHLIDSGLEGDSILFLITVVPDNCVWGGVPVLPAECWVICDMTPPKTLVHLVEYRQGRRESWEYAPSQTTICVPNVPSFLLFSTDEESGVDEIWWKADSGPWNRYNGEYNLSSFLEGSHDLSYYAVDMVGNKEAEKTVTIIVDMTPPSVRSLEPIGLLVAKSGSIRFHVVADDSGSGLESVKLTLDGTWLGYMLGGNDYWIYFDVAPGAHSWLVVATDKAGNQVVCSDIQFTLIVDEEPPTVSDVVISPSSPVMFEEIKVFAVVNDTLSGVKRVTMYYSTDDGRRWTGIPMIYRNNSYESTIPGVGPMTKVQYYIEALDGLENSVTTAKQEFTVGIPVWAYVVGVGFMFALSAMILLRRVRRSQATRGNQGSLRTETLGTKLATPL